MNQEELKYGTLSELEIMEKQALENLKAIQDEIKNRKVDNKKTLVETKVKELLDSHQDELLFLKLSRNGTGPQVDILRLNGCTVEYLTEDKCVTLTPTKYSSFSAYHAANICACNIDFSFKPEYGKVTLSVEDLDVLLKQIKESIKDKNYVKAYLIKTINDHIDYSRKRLFEEAERNFGIEFDASFQNKEK